MPELLVIFYNLYYFTLRIIEIVFLEKNVWILPWKLICHGSNIEFAIIILIVVLMFIWSKGPYRVIEGLWPSQKLEGGACTALNF